MNVVIAYTNPFPYGDANANRVISYAKELVRLGDKITVHCLQPSVRPSEVDNPSIPKPEVKGTFEGIDYIHTAGSFMWPEKGKGLIKKKFIRIKSYINSFRLIYQNRKSIDLLQVCVADDVAFYFFYCVAKICKIKFIVERGELPYYVKFREQYEGKFFKKIKVLLTKRSFQFFDGMILETQTLVDYYRTVAKPEIPFCVVPMTVEEERFINVKKKPTKYGRYIGYCGNMLEIDGISILIRSFAMIANKFSDVMLLLAGNSCETPKQKELAKQLEIDNRIVFLGKLSREEIPQFLANAEVLALASPLSIRASATMPCKVGEYLCTCNPVVVTGQGEVNKYLKDGVSAYLPNPDSVEDFAAKLEIALSRTPEVRAVGVKGKDVALKEFSSVVQSRKIHDFYTSIVS